MARSSVTTDSDGTTKWHVNGRLHREDGPAIEMADGRKEWYIDGQPHREDGPAIEYADGSKEWYQNGQLHRDDGPAIEYPDGMRVWFQNGDWHRADGPAIEHANGGPKEWYLHGKPWPEGEKAWRDQHQELAKAIDEITKGSNGPITLTKPPRFKPKQT